jgi:hypothetical protein
LATALSDSSRIEAAHKKELEENPKGFHLEGHFTSLVCGLSAANENSWYDKSGFKCMPCQKALGKKLYDLERYFNIDRPDLTKYVKSGVGQR